MPYLTPGRGILFPQEGWGILEDTKLSLAKG